MLVPAAWAEEVEAPAAPASHIHDVVSLFNRDHEAFDRISGRLREFEARHGIPVYLAVYSRLMFENAGAQGRFLHDRWIGSGADGVVILFDIDQGKTVLTLPMASAGPEGVGSNTRLPAFSIEPVVRELGALKPGAKGEIAFLDRYTGLLVERLDGLLTEEVGGGASPWRFAFLTLAFGAVLGGIGVFIHRVLRESTKKSRERHRFPEVEIETRLGASHGGARVNVLSYRSQPPERDARS